MSRVLYSASKDDFILDVVLHRFAQKMQESARLNRIGFGDSEVQSWIHNAPEIQNLLTVAGVPSDTYISFEYRIPHGCSRIDCMLYGKGEDLKSNVVHIELKQWSNSSVSELYSTGVFQVEAFTGGHYHPVAHPSQQVANYQQYLTDYVEAFQDQCKLTGIAYCYNYDSSLNPADLYSNHYHAILDRFPLYAGNQVLELASRINKLLCLGDGFRIFNNVQDSPIRPSKNLMDAAANMFKGITEFTLIQDQLVASEAIFGEIERTINSQGKTVVIVKGGPGTGKTVIALHILSQLAHEGKYPNSFFTTRSKALRNNLKAKLKDIQVNNNRTGDAGNLVRNIFEFKPYHYKENELDVLLVDEAHRISNSSNHMSDKKYETTHLSRVISLIYCSKVCVFFIDDHQAITSTEIGTSELIRNAAESYKSRLNDEKQAFLVEIGKLETRLPRLEKRRFDLIDRRECFTASQFSQELTKLEARIKDLKSDIKKKDNISDVDSSFVGEVTVLDFELKSQFRCNGSDNYLDWLDETLYRPYNSVQTTFDKKEYDFRVFDSPNELYAKIRELDQPNGNPKQSARIAAGYCWEWKGELTPEGDLKKEVVLDDYNFAMPWETLKPARAPFRYNYASSADTWALEPEGINQVGCVFSIQGLELDYIGVIIGPDLTYDPVHDCLKAVPGVTHNMNAGDDPDKYVKNIYRVLMSRGKKGCFVFCCNKDVASFIERCSLKK